MRDSESRGFTLIEVLAVLAILIGLLAVAVILSRPKSFAASEADASRRLGLAAIAQGLQDFKRINGSFPPAIPAEQTNISGPTTGFNLCWYLVPTYLKDMPLDPEIGLAYTGNESDPQIVTEPCNAAKVAYVSGYTIKQAKDGVVTLSAIGSNLRPLVMSIR